ncbi:MAG TPA: hypothetical protein VM324_12695 [Egibacteraceae bacterium]|nr:hypothetical protein [Egibacteraceae bacterium]
MTTVTESRTFRIVVSVLLVVVLLTGVAVLVTRAGGPGNDEPERVPFVQDDRPPEERARAHLDQLPDGEHQGRFIAVDPLTVTFRLVRILPAGAPEGPVEDTFQTVTLPIAPDAGIVIFNCANGCQEVPTTLEALVAGEVAPHGQGEAYFVFRLAGGTVVAMSEVIVGG